MYNKKIPGRLFVFFLVAMIVAGSLTVHAQSIANPCINLGAQPTVPSTPDGATKCTTDYTACINSGADAGVCSSLATQEGEAWVAYAICTQNHINFPNNINYSTTICQENFSVAGQTYSDIQNAINQAKNNAVAATSCNNTGGTITHDSSGNVVCTKQYTCPTGQTWSSLGGSSGGQGGCVSTPPAPATQLTYTPLEPLPGGFQGVQTGNIGPYVVSIFQLLMVIGAFLAVGALVVGGITYMVSEVVDKKSEAKQRIRAALWGLLLLLGAFLILNTINPQLVNFGGLFNPTAGLPNNPPATSGSGASPPTAAQLQAQTNQCNQLSGCSAQTNSDGTVSCTCL